MQKLQEILLKVPLQKIIFKKGARNEKTVIRDYYYYAGKIKISMGC